MTDSMALYLQKEQNIQSTILEIAKIDTKATNSGTQQITRHFNP
jgi:hypothetical protein